jgi:hypothetical protein
MTGAAELGIDPGLLERFRKAGAQLVWSDLRESPPGVRRAPRRGGGPAVRTARLSDESARVETTDGPDGYRIVTDSGPVGALVVLLACGERGLPDRLHPLLAGESPRFPMGAIEAAWGGSAAGGRALSISDLVGLARYALP